MWVHLLIFIGVLMFCRSTQTDVGEFDMDVYTVAFAQGLRRLASRCFGERERERRGGGGGGGKSACA
jgi:hypothetical protein